MRCVAVKRELSVPTGGLSAAEVAAHLAGCPRCASWAEQSERLDRLWDATRPDEPEPADWERVWSRVIKALDRGESSPARAAITSRRASWVRPWRRAAIAALALAQAAAIVLAVLLPGRPAPAAIVQVEITEGKTGLIELDGPQQVEYKDLDLDRDPGSHDAVATNFELLNTFETLAELE
jgi:hypothetical protein